MLRLWKRLKFILNVRQFLPFLWEFYTSRAVPGRTKFFSLFWVLVYFIFPFDAIPDFLAFIGILDDLAVLTFILQRIVAMAPPELKQRYGILEQRNR